MSSIITKNLKVTLAEQVYNLLDLGSNTYLPSSRQSNLYAVLGKQLPWNVGTEVVPAPEDTTNYLNSLYDDALFVKRLTNAEASYIVPRINWESGEVYDAYVDNEDVYETNFYVLNSQYKVFKCLYNNDGEPSTDEPDITLSTTSLEEPYIETSDGYKWKYLYTLNSLQRQRYLTNDWMPVTKNSFVSAAAINGSLDIVNITNSGNNYVDGITQNIISVSGDGIGAVMRANVSNGQIQDVIIQNRGSNYTHATLTINDIVGGVGSSAAAEVVISPQNGHGFDPVYELGASNIMFNSDFDGLDTTFLSENDYRQVFVVGNPQEASGVKATSEKYTCYYKLRVSPGLGDFNEDEVVYQGVTFEGANWTANVVFFDAVSNLLYVNKVKGSPITNQSVKGLDTGSIRIINTIENPTLKLYSGKVLYISNSAVISREENQTDRIRFILSF
jgi:hypothetical protein